MDIKPIETQYKGYRFRSRLEARWAVFFDALGVQWEYEKEGYDLGEYGWYLPDFWFPKTQHFAEVKPEADLSAAEDAKISSFKRLVCPNLHLLKGPPVTFRDDDRKKRFESHLTQMILCACLERQDGIFRDRFSIDDLRRASIAARSARFEHGESPRIVKQ